MLLQKHPTIYETLKRIGHAEQRKLDTWSISLTSGKHIRSPRGLHLLLHAHSTIPQVASAIDC